MAYTYTTDPLLGLLAIYDNYVTGRWNFPDAVGTSVSAPGGIGNSVALTYSFLAAETSYFQTSGFATFTSTEKSAARDVLASISEMVNIEFTEIGGIGDITFAMNAQSGSSGYAYYPSFIYYFVGDDITDVEMDELGGDIYLNSSMTWTAAGFLPGGWGYGTLVHELGHALGLKHPFEGSNYVLDSSIDNTAYTVMSYTEHPYSWFREVTQSGGSYSWSYEQISPETLMPLDILALQYLYGANTTSNLENNSYTFSTDTPFIKTIWDAGGTDSISVSNFEIACRIDLQEGSYSSIHIPSDPLPEGYEETNSGIYDGTDNLAIAYGTIIENAIGGSGDDLLIGNSADNILTGSKGDDTLQGNDGMDTAKFAGSRTDYAIAAESGGFSIIDSVAGRDGTDSLLDIERLLFADSALFLDELGNWQTDPDFTPDLTPLYPTKAGGTIYLGTDAHDLVNSGNANDKINVGNGDNTVNAGGGNNKIIAGTGYDTIVTLGGNDKITAGDGDNTINAGDGNNTIITGTGADNITTGNGNDKITAGDGDNNIDAGDGNNKVTTGSGSDLILCGSGKDKIMAGGGGDRIDAGAGTDKIYGEAGADTFVFSNLATGEFDTIGDFAHGDLLEFDTTVFIELSGATAGNLAFGTTAVDADDLLIYNPAKGILLFDADGSASGAAIKLAVVKGMDAKTLTFDDFLFV